VPYVDIQTVHNPATGTVAPAAWGDQIRDDLEFLIDPPGCSLFHSTTQSVPNDTGTQLAANSESYDNDAMHSTVSNTSRITCQTAGRYLFTATIEYSANATGRRAANLFRNATTIVNGSNTTAINGAATFVTVTRTLVLAASDFV
jgi:hypothetical protein